MTITDAAPQRRRRWPWVVLIVVVVLAALAVAAEFVVRSILPGVVRGIVIEQLDLPSDQRIDVEASGVLLPQLIGGRLDELHLSSDAVTLGGITGAAEVTAEGVPLGGGDLRAAHGTIRIGQDQFAALLSGSDLPLEEIGFDEPDVTIGGALSLFGLDIPVSFTGTPDADDGDLLITPVRVLIGGLELDAEQVADRFGDAGERLTGPQRVCIADRLPAGLTLTGLRIQGAEAVIDLDVDGAIVTDERLQQNGTCE